jgi:uncharacterized protein (UPF0261 family)
MKRIAVLGTFDTKGEEHAYLADCIRERGHDVLTVDVGGFGTPVWPADIDADAVAAVGGVDLAALRSRGDRGALVEAMGRAATVMLARLVADGRIDGVVSLGGSGGTAIATAAMRALPTGFPKVMVSTVASGNVAPYIGVRDIVMFPSIVDVAGLNRFSRAAFRRAAAAICAIADVDGPPAGDGAPLVVASMFGNTSAGVEHARRQLERRGYEVLVFHATGTGGQAMESLVESGCVNGVLDITTTEWADELVGGVLTAGRTRLEGAARHGVPAVIAPGCLDMVNFGATETIPAQFAGRTFYRHNPQVTLMRTTPAECAELGRIVAEKVNLSTGPVTVLVPLKGISVISAPGGPFHHPAADAALFAALRRHLRRDIPLVEIDAAINDATFAEACASALLQNMNTHAAHLARAAAWTPAAIRSAADGPWV